MAKVFTISANIEVALTIEQIWPDGDAPENPSSADVLAALKETDEWSPMRALEEWNLADDMNLTVWAHVEKDAPKDIARW